MVRRSTSRLGAGALVAALLLSSCITSALWEADSRPERGESPFVAKLCLTPFTLFLDLLTLPFQEWWYDEQDDFDSC